MKKEFIRGACAPPKPSKAYVEGWARVFQCKHRFASPCGAFDAGRCILKRNHEGEHEPDPEDDGRTAGYFDLGCLPPGHNSRINFGT